MKFSEYKKRILEIDEDVKKEYLKKDFDLETCNLITIARLHARLTQKELAKKINTKQPSVARVEGGHLPTLPFLKKVAKAIETTLIPPRFAFMEDYSTKNNSELFSHNNTINLVSTQTLNIPANDFEGKSDWTFNEKNSIPCDYVEKQAVNC